MQYLLSPAILAVDDDENIRSVIADYFQAIHNIPVVQASGVHEALAIAEAYERHWILVISDYQMLDGDGVQLIRQLKAKDIEVESWLLISGIATENKVIVDLLHEFPDVKFIKKPFGSHELSQLLFRGGK